MNTKKSATKKTTVVAKEASAVLGKNVSKGAIKAVTASNLRKPATRKGKSAARSVRVIMDPAAKPKYFSVTAIRNAVRLVVASK